MEVEGVGIGGSGRWREWEVEKVGGEESEKWRKWEVEGVGGGESGRWREWEVEKVGGEESGKWRESPTYVTYVVFCCAATGSSHLVTTPERRGLSITAPVEDGVTVRSAVAP